MQATELQRQQFREFHQLLEATLSGVTAEQLHLVPPGTASSTSIPVPTPRPRAVSATGLCSSSVPTWPFAVPGWSRSTSMEGGNGADGRLGHTVEGSDFCVLRARPLAAGGDAQHLILVGDVLVG